MPGPAGVQSHARAFLQALQAVRKCLRALDGAVNTAAVFRARVRQLVGQLVRAGLQLHQLAHQVILRDRLQRAGVDLQLHAARLICQLLAARDGGAVDRSPIPGSKELADQARGVQLQINAGPLQAVTENNLVGQLMQLQAGAHELANQLSDPSAKYRGGVDSAVEGAKTLADGLKRLQEGSCVALYARRTWHMKDLHPELSV